MISSVESKLGALCIHSKLFNVLVCVCEGGGIPTLCMKRWIMFLSSFNAQSDRYMHVVLCIMYRISCLFFFVWEWWSITLSVPLPTHLQFSLTASHVSQLPSLNFLVYIPKKSEYPLYIRQSSKSNESTDAFLVAQWGGVMIYNPPEASKLKEIESQRNSTGNETEREDRRDSQTSSTDHKGALNVAVKMERVMPVFVQQLKMLLGVSSNNWVSCGTVLGRKGRSP